ncbi:hypothetical protein [Streptomyces arenae]|uniref:hypothetical protein n=1 Tax=Streptomyces arenae TaxID=29301 RepID=UPI0026587BC0|nr:hypothetical protein [Streptomyces arenae]MCG7205352.1 hypothetical protein [Streptomyces arenae]
MPDARRLLPVPDHLSDSTACQLGVNALIALLLVTREFDAQPGEWGSGMDGSYRPGWKGVTTQPHAQP